MPPFIDYLRRHPARFTKQRIIGRVIADFYSASAGLVIEVDGSQHYEDDGPERDRRRTEYLNGLGIDVLRVLNNDIRSNFCGVCDHIEQEIRKRIDAEALK